MKMNDRSWAWLTAIAGLAAAAYSNNFWVAIIPFMIVWALLAND